MNGQAQGFLVVSALAGTLFCVYLASPFLPAILGALLLAVLFDPLQDRLEQALGGRRSVAALAVVLIVLVAVLIPAAMVVSAALGELRDLYSQLNARSAAGGGWLAQIERATGPGLEWLSLRTGVPAEEIRAALVERLAGISGSVLRGTTAVAAGLTEAIVQTAVAVMTLFFLLRDGAGILAHVRANSPLPDEQTAELIESTGAAITANVYGVLAVAVAQGTLAGVGYWLTGLHGPVLWALVTALFSMVPLIGTSAVWIPAVAVLAAGGDYGRAALLAVWSAALVGMADNVVRPWVIGQRTNASPLLVFFALLGGAKLFGLAGLFIGPVVLSVTAVLLKFWSASRNAVR
ncbi:MAG: AI-2E family transporter [Bryobacterales bacterium]|nr:AI-2E family transporter [Bryobacterales bacterium]